LCSSSRSIATAWVRGHHAESARGPAGQRRQLSLQRAAAGEYLLAAANDYDPRELYSASFLEQLAAAAIKLTIADGEKKVQDLKIGGLFHD
jgi:hypothetical protein